MKHKTQYAEQSQDASPLHRARLLVEANPCLGNGAGQFEFELSGSVLVVSGRLPSFYLKQLLQNLLAKVEGVTRVDNRVRVISCAGLSSLESESGPAFEVKELRRKEGRSKDGSLNNQS